MKNKNRDKRAVQIQENIRAILIKKWDPIDVCDVPETQDEYNGYVGGIYRLIANGVDENEIAEHLYKIESENMGLKPSIKHLKDVASELIEIDVTI